MKRSLLILVSLAVMMLRPPFVFGEIQKTGVLNRVPAIQTRKEWNRFKILVWQYQTSVLKDIDLYRRAGLEGFHIDRGAGEEKLVEFSVREQFPYYVDHIADKGFLHLTGKNVDAVIGKRGLATRPHSFADPNTMTQMMQHIARNVDATKNGLTLAYAFDDEISLGSFVAPCDVDRHPLSIGWFREWLQHQYSEISFLNRRWDSNFKSFDEVMPKSFEDVRRGVQRPLSQWSLAPWMDFRNFMDFQFASVLSELTRYANSLDPKTPAGFVGGQGPGPYGGYDYAMLARVCTVDGGF